MVFSSLVVAPKRCIRVAFAMADVGVGVELEMSDGMVVQVASKTLRQFVATVTSEGLDKGENVTVRTRHAPTGVLTLDAPAM